MPKDKFYVDEGDLMFPSDKKQKTRKKGMQGQSEEQREEEIELSPEELQAIIDEVKAGQ